MAIKKKEKTKVNRKEAEKKHQRFILPRAPSFLL